MVDKVRAADLGEVEVADMSMVDGLGDARCFMRTSIVWLRSVRNGNSAGVTVLLLL